MVRGRSSVYASRPYSVPLCSSQRPARFVQAQTPGWRLLIRDAAFSAFLSKPAVFWATIAVANVLHSAPLETRGRTAFRETGIENEFRGVALGKRSRPITAIRFLYRWTLDRDWPLFQKKNSPAQATASSRGSQPERLEARQLLSQVYRDAPGRPRVDDAGARSDRDGLEWPRALRSPVPTGSNIFSVAYLYSSNSATAS